MIYTTTKQNTKAFIWNTRRDIDLQTGDNLSDYTGLEDEFDSINLSHTLSRVCSENEVVMLSPCLMTVTTGINRGCRVWIDRINLNALPEIDDPQRTFEYYCEQ